ncbi:hypothetical protein M2139_001854 [Enterococcus sp. PF1-24]|uniref:hypothetical protein n=1 Tax=unclassified Enterococcus TaxID=2608891 RepID=UPI002474FCDE|nr:MULTISPECIES: hypothetical protein [unclassified Enterococcus]MDH6364822.1 hypothetical protein [Enterococcus sp. PFB1-1]MDH6401954.1 hypothetical protein [Enterococcus sp. PF1-24]
MNIFQEIISIIAGLTRDFAPFLRVGWTAALIVGLVFIFIGFIAEKNVNRQTFQWVLGVFGVLMVVSSGAQLILSFI